ncbi:MAG: (d)CMP kinase [Lachnospiraceae bacterium]|nr:(d)CMP kinase [Lachnospiraceae bacterium]
MSYQVAIDGPAGAGKSTIAKIVAAKKSFIYVDTGAMYRAMAVYMVRNNVDPSNEDEVSARAEKADISLEYVDGIQHVFLNGEDVTGQLRTEETGNMASVVSKYTAVRTRLVDIQKNIASKTNVVMDGRDIGTVVLPDADVKVYLTASSAVRAKRRYDELVAKGEKPDINKIEEDIIARDRQDMTREISPLKKADDAVEIDSSYMTIEEVADKILSLCGEK